MVERFWYPNTVNKEFVYLSSLQSSNEDLYDKAREELQKVNDNVFSKRIEDNLKVLNVLVKREREKERTLIESYGLPWSKKYGDQLKAINLLLGTELMLKRNLSAIRKVKKGRKGGTELSRDFFTHLQDEMDKLKMEEVGTDMIEQCIYNALENTYAETFEEDGEEKIVYDRLLKELRDKTSGTSEYLIRKMLKEYFDIDVDAKDKITRVTAEDIKKRMKDFRSGYRKTGFLMEYVEEVRLQLMESVFVKTGEEGKFKVIHSGAMQMKPDNLLSIGFAIDLETFFER